MAHIDIKYRELVNKIQREGFRYLDPKRSQQDIHRIQIPKFNFEYDMKHGFPLLTTKKINTKALIGEFKAFTAGATHVKQLYNLGVNFWFKDAYNRYKRIFFGEIDGIDRSKQNTLISFEDFCKTIKDEDFEYLNDLRGQLGPIYSAQMRSWGENVSIDQLQKAIDNIRQNPHCTKNTITMWNPSQENEQALSCCHWAFQILLQPLSPIETIEQAKKDGLWKTGDEFDPLQLCVGEYDYDAYEKFIDQSKFKKYKISLQWHQHSVDTFLGLPFNIAYYAMMLKFIANATNTVAGTLYGDLTNVHIYTDHIPAIKEQMNRSDIMHDAPQLQLQSKEIEDLITEDISFKNYSSYSFLKAEMFTYD